MKRDVESLKRELLGSDGLAGGTGLAEHLIRRALEVAPDLAAGNVEDAKKALDLVDELFDSNRSSTCAKTALAFVEAIGGLDYDAEFCRLRGELRNRLILFTGRS